MANRRRGRGSARNHCKVGREVQIKNLVDFDNSVKRTLPPLNNRQVFEPYDAEDKVNTLTRALGLSGEADELIEVYFEGHTLKNLSPRAVDESGDLLFYCSALADAYMVSLPTCIEYYCNDNMDRFKTFGNPLLRSGAVEFVVVETLGWLYGGGTPFNKPPAIQGPFYSCYEFARDLRRLVKPLTELVKKIEGHGHPKDAKAVAIKIGEITLFLASAAPLGPICQSNHDKLLKRYPNGFNTNDSMNRKD